MRPACILIALASCFSPSPPAGAPCAPLGAADRCPAGQLCIDETCQLAGAIVDSGPQADAVAPIDAPGDRDHDGILDSVDNCPDTANPSQVDEDRDGLGDACDPCPPFPDNHDSDGDGLGDACDPNPSVTGDRLVAFEGFEDALSGSWTIMGTFTASNGDGVLSAADATTSVLTRPSPDGARAEIRAAFVIDSITATGLNLGAIAVIDRMRPNSDESVTCQLAGLAAGTQQAVRIFDTSASAEVASASYPFARGDAKELRLARNGTSYACSITAPMAKLAGASTFAPASPRIGLRVHGAAARWHWVMVVTSP